MKRILLILALAATIATPAMNGLARASDAATARENGSVAKIICRIAIGSIGSPYFGMLAGGCVWFAVLEFLA
jgi:hypothetical protein